MKAVETISLGELRTKYREVYDAVMARVAFGTPDIAPSKFTVVHDPEEAGRVLITSDQVHNFPVYQHQRRSEVEQHLKVIRSSAEFALAGTGSGQVAEPRKVLTRILARVSEIRKALNLDQTQP